MRFSDASGRKVVSTATADQVGKVGAFVVDPVSRRVVALELKKTDGGDTLPWENILAFGTDAVTVETVEKIGEHSEAVGELIGKDHHLVGKRTLSDSGDELGKVADVEFDPESGTVTSLMVGDSEIAGERLVGVGSYAVVVKAE